MIKHIRYIMFTLLALMCLQSSQVYAASNDAIYENAKQQVTEEYSNKINSIANGEGITSGGIIIKGFWNNFDRIYKDIKMFAPLLIVAMEVLGALFVIFARKNKSLRRWGLLGLCITLPLLVIVVVYALPYVRVIMTI